MKELAQNKRRVVVSVVESTRFIFLFQAKCISSANWKNYWVFKYVHSSIDTVATFSCRHLKGMTEIHYINNEYRIWKSPFSFSSHLLFRHWIFFPSLHLLFPLLNSNPLLLSFLFTSAGDLPQVPSRSDSYSRSLPHWHEESASAGSHRHDSAVRPLRAWGQKA